MCTRGRTTAALLCEVSILVLRAARVGASSLRPLSYRFSPRANQRRRMRGRAARCPRRPTLGVVGASSVPSGQASGRAWPKRRRAGICPGLISDRGVHCAHTCASACTRQPRDDACDSVPNPHRRQQKPCRAPAAARMPTDRQGQRARFSTLRGCPASTARCLQSFRVMLRAGDVLPRTVRASRIANEQTCR